MASNRQCCPNHEDGTARECQNRQGSERMHAGVRQRVHLLHNQRSLRKVPAGKAQNSQWRGHPLCHDFPWLRELLRSFEDLSIPISRDPPRKSEQTTCPTTVPQRGQPRCRCRRRGCPTTRTEWRHGDDGKWQHRLRLPRPRRKRLRRLLNAASRTGGQIVYINSNLDLVRTSVRHLGHRKRRRLRIIGEMEKCERQREER